MNDSRALANVREDPLHSRYGSSVGLVTNKKRSSVLKFGAGFSLKVWIVLSDLRVANAWE